MFPSASRAGLVTGCRFSAIRAATLTCWALLEWPLVETTTGPEAAPWGTRAITKSSALTTTEASKSPKRTRGRRSSGGRRPLPRMRISPPGRAAAGATASICGRPFTFFFPRRRLEIVIESLSKSKGATVKEARNTKEVASAPARKRQRRRHLQQFLSPPAAAPVASPAEASQYRIHEKV